MTNKLLQVLQPTGKVNGKAPAIDKEKLIKFYRIMVLTRTLDERALKLQRSGRIGFYVSCLGQEAVQVAAAGALQENDWVFPTYRDPGIALYMGANLTDMMHQCFGNEKDLTNGTQMPVHYAFRKPNFVSISSPIGTQLTQAVGAAMAAQYKKDKTVILACVGDGGTSSNDFHAGMNFAGVFKAPVVFLCINNQWAISVPSSKQTASKTMAIKAEAYGMPGVLVDGNDALAVYQVMSEAVQRARQGAGPTLIEAFTFRMGSHSSSDDWKKYRDVKDVEEWSKKDPLPRLQKYLQEQGIWNEAFEKETQEWASNHVTEAIRAAESAGPPAVEKMFENVYAQMTPQLARQRDYLLEIERSGIKGDEEEGAFPL